MAVSLQFYPTQTSKAEVYRDGYERGRKAGASSSSHAVGASVDPTCSTDKPCSFQHWRRNQLPARLLQTSFRWHQLSPHRFTCAGTSCLRPSLLPHSSLPLELRNSTSSQVYGCVSTGGQPRPLWLTLIAVCVLMAVPPAACH